MNIKKISNFNFCCCKDIASRTKILRAVRIRPPVKLYIFLLIATLAIIAGPLKTAGSAEGERPLSLSNIEDLLLNDSSHMQEIAELIRELGVDFEKTTPEMITMLKSKNADKGVIDALIEKAEPEGHIKVTSTPMENISIMINGRQYTTPANTVVKPGSVRIVYSGSERFESYEKNIDVSYGKSSHIEIVMTPIPLSMDEITDKIDSYTPDKSIADDIVKCGVDFEWSLNDIYKLRNHDSIISAIFSVADPARLEWTFDNIYKLRDHSSIVSTILSVVDLVDFEWTDDIIYKLKDYGSIISAILTVTDPNDSILLVDSEPSDMPLVVNGIDRGNTPQIIKEELGDVAKITVMGDDIFKGQGVSAQIVGGITIEHIELEPLVLPDVFIKLMNISGNTVEPGRQVKINAVVSKKGPAKLRYTWKSDSGFFKLDNTLDPVNYWNAPFDQGDCNITVGVVNNSVVFGEGTRSIKVSSPNKDLNLGGYSRSRKLTSKIGMGSNLQISDVGFDSDNNMYVLDPSSNSIRVYFQTGEYYGSLCKGKISGPRAMVIRDNKIYLIHNQDSKNIERYGRSGKLKESYNSRKERKKDIVTVKEPTDLVAGSEGELYVLDGKKRNISVFEESGLYRLSFGNSGTETLERPIAIDVDSKENIYVLDAPKREPHKIVVYNSRMQYKRKISFIGTKFSSAKFTDMVSDKQKKTIFLTSSTARCVVSTDLSGENIGEFGYIDNPFKIAIDRFSNVYVTDMKNNSIFKFIQNSEKNYIHYGVFSNNSFKNITDIAADRHGSLFLLNGTSNEIVKVSKDGWELARFGGKSAGSKILKAPQTMVSGKGGDYIYVLDQAYYSERVLQFDNSGKFKGVIAGKKHNNKLFSPKDIDSDEYGNVYVLDRISWGKHRINVYSHSGDKINEIDLFGKKPTRVAAERHGRDFYVLFRDYIKKYEYSENKNKYKSKDYSDDVLKNTSLLRVSNYGRVMAAVTPGESTHDIRFFKEKINSTKNSNKGILEQTLYGRDSFKTAKDIEVDENENLYILDTTSNLSIYKQENLRYNYTSNRLTR